jgi:hypothetical protein
MAEVPVTGTQLPAAGTTFLMQITKGPLHSPRIGWSALVGRDGRPDRVETCDKGTPRAAIRV